VQRRKIPPLTQVKMGFVNWYKRNGFFFWNLGRKPAGANQMGGPFNGKNPFAFSLWAVVGLIFGINPWVRWVVLIKGKKSRKCGTPGRPPKFFFSHFWVGYSNSKKSPNKRRHGKKPDAGQIWEMRPLINPRFYFFFITYRGFWPVNKKIPNGECFSFNIAFFYFFKHGLEVPGGGQKYFGALKVKIFVGPLPKRKAFDELQNPLKKIFNFFAPYSQLKEDLSLKTTF